MNAATLAFFDDLRVDHGVVQIGHRIRAGAGLARALSHDQADPRLLRASVAPPSVSHWLGWFGAAKTSTRCIMPMSSWLMMWQCMTKQLTETGLNQIRKVIEPGLRSLMFGGPGGSFGWGCIAGTMMVSCHSGVGSGLPLI
jgi:hypothetical protein